MDGKYTDVSAKDGLYFKGASLDDKHFVDAVRRSLRESDLRPAQKWRIERRLNRPAFVRKLKEEVRADWIWSQDDPEEAQARGIDWSEIDWQAIISVALMLLKLFT